MIFLATLTVIFICYLLLTKDSKYKNLPSVGINLPLIGHAYRLGTKEFKKDPFNEIWRLYRKYQKNGMVFLCGENGSYHHDVLQKSSFPMIVRGHTLLGLY